MGGELPGLLNEALLFLDGVRVELNRSQADGVAISLADIIVLAVALPSSRQRGTRGYDITVPFKPGARTPRRSRRTWSRSPCSTPPSTGSPSMPEPGRGPSPETLLVERADAVDADRARRWRSGSAGARPRRQLREDPTRRPDRSARDADQRLLRDLLDIDHRAEGIRLGREPCTRAGSRDGRAQDGPPPPSTSSSVTTPAPGHLGGLTHLTMRR